MMAPMARPFDVVVVRPDLGRKNVRPDERVGRPKCRLFVSRLLGLIVGMRLTKFMGESYMPTRSLPRAAHPARGMDRAGRPS
jgi:hypothetical protein